MSLNSNRFQLILLFLLILPCSISVATDASNTVESAPLPDQKKLQTEVTPPLEQEKSPVEISPDDPVHAGEAEHAFKQANVCEGMEKGDYLGAQVCNDCHQDTTDTMRASPHGQASDARSPFGQKGCETCHGPGMLHFETEGNCIISMTGRYGESVEHRNDICLNCHKSGERIHWTSSAHETEGLVCVSCHSIHRTNDVMERTSQAQICMSCHKDIRAQTLRAYSHPIQDKKSTCSDCHNSHGSAGPSSLKQLSINENCYSCHAEKRGPFLWEHFPVTEDCTLCHRVHGSNHQSLLTKPGPQLCQQCHAAIGSGGGLNHINNLLDFNTSDPGRSRFTVSMNCANCHSKVHGSNHPSGAFLQR